MLFAHASLSLAPSLGRGAHRANSRDAEAVSKKSEQRRPGQVGSTRLAAERNRERAHEPQAPPPGGWIGTPSSRPSARSSSTRPGSPSGRTTAACPPMPTARMACIGRSARCCAQAPDEQQALIDAHPDLAGRLARAGRLTADSSQEQASAGLDQLTDRERARFIALNEAYQARFGFPVHHGGQGAHQGRDPGGLRAPPRERSAAEQGPRSKRSSASRCFVSRTCCRESGASTFGTALMARLDALATFSDDPARLTRLYLSPAHCRAMEQVAAWMRAAGMAARIDAVGNVIGRYQASRYGAPAVLIGSHIDTVTDAGKYDGALGVLAGIAAVETLHRSGQRLPVALEVIAFGDEEGVRFPTALTGSRALAGTLDPDAARCPRRRGRRHARGAGRGRLRSRSLRELRPARRGRARLSRGPHRAGPRARGRGPAARHRHRDQWCHRAGGSGQGRGRSCRHRADGPAPRRARRGRRDGARGRARGPGDGRTWSRPSVRSRRCPARPTSCRGRRASRSTSGRPSDATRLAALAVLEASFAAIAARRGVEVAIERFHDAAGCRPAIRR